MCVRDSRGADSARVFAKLPALERQRAQGRPGARCTRGLVCNSAQRTRTRAYRFSGEHPAFPAQWLYGLLRALPGERLFCHRRPSGNFASQELDASTAASGPHDFAVRFTPHSSDMASASTATCPNVRDDGRRPSGGTGWRHSSFDLPDGLSGIFLCEGMDRLLLICPSGCFVALAMQLRHCKRSDTIDSRFAPPRNYARFVDTIPHSAISAIKSEISTL